MGLILLITIVFQSTGKIRGSFLLSISRQGVLFVLVLMIARATAGYYGILAAQAISDGLTLIFAATLFYNEWKGELFSSSSNEHQSEIKG